MLLNMQNQSHSHHSTLKILEQGNNCHRHGDGERRRSLTFADKFEVKFFFRYEEPRKVASALTNYTLPSLDWDEKQKADYEYDDEEYNDEDNYLPQIHYPSYDNMIEEEGEEEYEMNDDYTHSYSYPQSNGYYSNTPIHLTYPLYHTNYEDYSFGQDTSSYENYSFGHDSSYYENYSYGYDNDDNDDYDMNQNYEKSSNGITKRISDDSDEENENINSSFRLSSFTNSPIQPQPQPQTNHAEKINYLPTSFHTRSRLVNPSLSIQLPISTTTESSNNSAIPLLSPTSPSSTTSTSTRRLALAKLQHGMERRKQQAEQRRNSYDEAQNTSSSSYSDIQHKPRRNSYDMAQHQNHQLRNNLEMVKEEEEKEKLDVVTSSMVSTIPPSEYLSPYSSYEQQQKIQFIQTSTQQQQEQQESSYILPSISDTTDEHDENGQSIRIIVTSVNQEVKEITTVYLDTPVNNKTNSKMLSKEEKPEEKKEMEMSKEKKIEEKDKSMEKEKEVKMEKVKIEKINEKNNKDNHIKNSTILNNNSKSTKSSHNNNTIVSHTTLNNNNNNEVKLVKSPKLFVSPFILLMMTIKSIYSPSQLPSFMTNINHNILFTDTYINLNLFEANSAILEPQTSSILESTTTTTTTSSSSSSNSSPFDSSLEENSVHPNTLTMNEILSSVLHPSLLKYTNDQGHVEDDLNYDLNSDNRQLQLFSTTFPFSNCDLDKTKPFLTSGFYFSKDFISSEIEPSTTDLSHDITNLLTNDMISSFPTSFQSYIYEILLKRQSIHSIHDFKDKKDEMDEEMKTIPLIKEKSKSVLFINHTSSTTPITNTNEILPKKNRNRNKKNKNKNKNRKQKNKNKNRKNKNRNKYRNRN